MTTATINIEKHCQRKVSTVKKMVAEIKRDMRDPCPPVPTFGKAVSSFEAVKRYLCPYNIDDGSFGRPELLAIHHI